MSDPAADGSHGWYVTAEVADGPSVEVFPGPGETEFFVSYPDGSMVVGLGSRGWDVAESGRALSPTARALLVRVRDDERVEMVRALNAQWLYSSVADLAAELGDESAEVRARCRFEAWSVPPGALRDLCVSAADGWEQDPALLVLSLAAAYDAACS